MVIRRSNTTVFDRTLYAGETEKVRLYKRGDDQRQGTVVAYILFNCRHTHVAKDGETIENDTSSGMRTTWFIPLRELRRHGITYLNAADRIEQLTGKEAGRQWIPESTTSITESLFGNMIVVDCLVYRPRRATNG